MNSNNWIEDFKKLGLIVGDKVFCPNTHTILKLVFKGGMGCYILQKGKTIQDLAETKFEDTDFAIDTTINGEWVTWTENIPKDEYTVVDKIHQKLDLLLSYSLININMKNNIQRFYGNMEWFESTDQPDDIEQLPKEFQQAQALWEKDSEGNIDKIIKLLTPFVGARFIPSNISNWEELFKDSNGEGNIELDAISVKVVGIEFTGLPIPNCKAEAHFEAKVTEQFPTTDLSEWQDQNGPFTDGIVFYWNFPTEGDLEDLDFTSGDNQGVECIAVK